MRTQNQTIDDQPIDDIPVSPRLPPLRPSRYGSVPGLDDSELADPEELERQVTLTEWGPLLALPKPTRRTWIEPVVEDGIVHYGAFSTVDFERLHGGFDTVRYKAQKLREELKDVLIRFHMVKERMPGTAKYLVLKYLKMGIIELENIVDSDMRALGRLYLRMQRLRQEIAKLQEASRRRHQQRAEAFWQSF